MRRITRHAAPPLLALLVFLTGGELLARALDIVDRLNGYNRLLFTRGPSPDLPYLLRPGVDTTFLGTPAHINHLGFRGSEVRPTPAPGVHRVLMLGDSVAFGMGVDEDAMPSTVVERELNAAGGTPYEVINAGVPGFDAVASVRFLETTGLAFRPQTVVLCASLNDFDPTPAYSPLGVLTRNPEGDYAPGLLDRSEFALLLRWLLSYARGTLQFQLQERLEQMHQDARRLGHTGAGFARAVAQSHLRFYRDPEPALWARLAGAYQALGRIASEHRVRVMVAIFPEQYQLAAPDQDLLPQQRLLELCRQANLYCLDLQPGLAAGGGELFADVQHPNAHGYAAAGTAIAAALLESHSHPGVTND